MARAEPPSTMMGTLGVRESNSARMTTPATMRIIRAFREIGMGVGLLGDPATSGPRSDQFAWTTRRIPIFPGRRRRA